MNHYWNITAYKSVCRNTVHLLKAVGKICFAFLVVILVHCEAQSQITKNSKTEVFLNTDPASTSAFRIAAPGNDDCGNAQTVNPNGCYPGTTVAANDSWVGSVGCQSGNNHPDVWYTFVATGTTLAVNVNALTLTGNIEFVLVGSTGPCTGLGISGFGSSLILMKRQLNKFA